MKLSCSDFAQHALGIDLWPKQREILDDLFENNISHSIWAMGRRCVTADTLVATGKGLIEIGSIAGQGQSIGDGWEQCDLFVAQPTGQARNAAMFYKGGIQDIIRIRTSRGFEVAGTPNHPVMVMNKEGDHRWRPLGRIKKDDQIVIRPMMYLALSYDHRLIDGREAVGFLVRVKECLENPERLMLEV